MHKYIRSFLSLIALLAAILPINAFAIEEEPSPDGPNEPTFSITYDFNGGATFEGEPTYKKEGLVAFAPFLNEGTLVSCFDYNSELDECHPLEVAHGKKLEYVTVNDERHDLGEDDAFMLNQDTTIVYYWTDNQKSAEDESGNSITFNDDGEHEYTLYLESISFNMTDEELSEFGLTREEYEAGKAMYIEAVSDEGEIISVFNIDVCDEDDRCVQDGPFEIKIKLTDEMKGYDNYKLIYINDEEAGPTTEEPIILTIEGGFLVGTLPHLSSYVLVGSNNTPAAPDTGTFSQISEAVAAIFPIASFLILLSLIVTLAAVRKTKR